MSIEQEQDGSFVIDPSDKNAFADWSSERLAEFKETYPKEWNALAKGYVVSVPGLPEETNPLPASYVDRWKELHKTGLQ
jgi:hypothetical protein